VITLVACLALVAPQVAQPAPEPPRSLRELVASSERIAWVRVDEVRAFDLGDSRLLRHQWPHGDVPFASVTVEGCELGDGEPESLLILAGDARLPGGGPALRVGMRALVFVERDGSLGWRLRRRKDGDFVNFVAERRVWALLPGGLWVVAGDGTRLVRPADGPPLALEGEADVDRAAFLAQLDLALDVELPRFEAHRITNGGTPFHVEFAGDGILRGTSQGRVSLDELRTLWEAVERERFDDLPKLVGATGGPCLTAMELCIVTRRGRRHVGIALGALEQLPEGDRRDATHRALRVWEALPIPDRPVLR
jgi:hypothetical protein